jgi:hypothetical protein
MLRVRCGQSFHFLSCRRWLLHFRSQNPKRRYVYIAGILFNLRCELVVCIRTETRFRIILKSTSLPLVLRSGLLLFELRARRLREPTRVALSFHNVVVVCACALWVLRMRIFACLSNSFDSRAAASGSDMARFCLNV